MPKLSTDYGSLIFPKDNFSKCSSQNFTLVSSECQLLIINRLNRFFNKKLDIDSLFTRKLVIYLKKLKKILQKI